jgi:hypothetical protein
MLIGVEISAEYFGQCSYVRAEKEPGTLLRTHLRFRREAPEA